MNASPLYTLLLRQAGVHGVYSIGRVQTPTLYMVYERDLAIKNFKPESYLELQAQVLTDDQSFKAKLEPYQRFNEQSQLNAFMTTKNVHMGPQDGLIVGVDTETKQQASPRLFSLSSLQSAMNKRVHVSASDTLKAVQSLYEAKLLTYPRTDCQYITDQEFAYLRDNLTAYQQLVAEDVTLDQLTASNRYVNGSKVQEYHAIIMTKTVPTSEQIKQLTPLAQQIYDLVLRTTTQKNHLHVSEQGVTLCQAVALEPLLTSPEMTAKWEVALKQISQKTRTPENFLGQIQQFIQKLVAEVPQQLQQSETVKNQIATQKQAQSDQQQAAELGLCRVCHQGKMIDRGKFYGCTAYQADDPCHFTLPKKWCGKNLPKAAIQSLITTGKTTKINGFQSKKTGKTFSASLVLNNN